MRTFAMLNPGAGAGGLGAGAGARVACREGEGVGVGVGLGEAEALGVGEVGPAMGSFLREQPARSNARAQRSAKARTVVRVTR